MNNSEKGRSMVEMLGVLAIIGILSAGALKGYSNAMFKYKMNKTIDEATRIFQRFEEINEKDWGSSENAEVGIYTDNVVSFGLMEKCVQESGFCHLPLGRVEFELHEQKGEDADLPGHWGMINFRFTDSKTCIGFLSAHWEQALPQDWWNPSGAILGCTNSIYDPHGAHGDGIQINTVSMADIIQQCSCCDNSVCDITFFYRGYV